MRGYLWIASSILADDPSGRATTTLPPEDRDQFAVRRRAFHQDFDDAWSAARAENGHKPPSAENTRTSLPTCGFNVAIARPFFLMVRIHVGICYRPLE
jgi:hypothetical protein